MAVVWKCTQKSQLAGRLVEAGELITLPDGQFPATAGFAPYNNEMVAQAVYVTAADVAELHPLALRHRMDKDRNPVYPTPGVYYRGGDGRVTTHP
jgi:hypothetical protein